jgi:hypothetical protein
MAKFQPSTYYHRGYAHAFSGQFRRPLIVSIEAQAPAVLSTLGGVGHSHVEGFHRPGLVSFKSASSHVSGSRQDETTYTTSVSTSIEGLRILDVLSADRVICHLTSEHKLGQDEGHILAIGSGFENLRFGAHRIEVHFRHEFFLNCPTFEHLAKHLAKDKKNDKISEVSKGAALCSLVDRIETHIPGVEVEGHLLHISHFGTIAFAEVLAEAGTRTLTMLRFDLGSPDQGTGAVAQALINGTHFP